MLTTSTTVPSGRTAAVLVLERRLADNERCGLTTALSTQSQIQTFTAIQRLSSCKCTRFTDSNNNNKFDISICCVVRCINRSSMASILICTAANVYKQLFKNTRVHLNVQCPHIKLEPQYKLL